MTLDAPSFAQVWSVWPCRALLLGFYLTAWVPNVYAQESAYFNIPAQPLATALEQYGNVTGRNALYNSNLASDHRSMAVQGHLSPDVALRILLEGTGLSARRATSNSFVLFQAPIAVAIMQSSAIAQFYGQIQRSLQRALCVDSDARPGSYRIAMRLWIDGVGNVTQYERLGSTGTSRLDESFDRTLRRLEIGAAPPDALAQPVSIAIRPLAPGVTMGCEEFVAPHAGTMP